MFTRDLKFGQNHSEYSNAQLGDVKKNSSNESLGSALDILLQEAHALHEKTDEIIFENPKMDLHFTSTSSGCLLEIAPA